MMRIGVAEACLMNLTYKKATIDDLDTLVKTRIEVLRAANELVDDINMDKVEQKSKEYYIKSLNNDVHTAYLVFDNNSFVGAGGVSYFSVLPTYHNPTGKKAYIMNMYVRPDYRRQGIATKMLDLLVEDAKVKGINAISLEATRMGKPLYEKYGFVKMENEIELLD